MNKTVRNTLLTFLVLSNIGCDQISKSIVRKNIDYYETIAIVSNFFTLTKIENEGAFLSFGDSLPYSFKLIFLTLLPLAALSYGLYLMYTRNRYWIFAIGISFVIGGGAGNLYDRILYGSVTDFLHLNFVVFQTGIFNLADVSIMAGMALIVFSQYFYRPKEAS